MDHLRIGLIGAGRISTAHANNVTALRDTTLQWVCDPVIDNADKVAAEHGGKVTTDPKDVIAADDVDAAILASPTPTHARLLDAAIDAGLPVLCEKPIDLDIAQVESLRPKASAASAVITLGFNRRFDPKFADLQRRVADGQIGALEQLTIISRDPAPAPRAYIASSGGIFRDMTIHDFDTARFFITSRSNPLPTLPPTPIRSATAASTAPPTGRSTSRPKYAAATRFWCRMAGMARRWPCPVTTSTTST
jgi:myo-inositol 2-dehydrogenase/D-chiro-inositol 1-dehydrogenase